MSFIRTLAGWLYLHQEGDGPWIGSLSRLCSCRVTRKRNGGNGPENSALHPVFYPSRSVSYFSCTWAPDVVNGFRDRVPSVHSVCQSANSWPKALKEEENGDECGTVTARYGQEQLLQYNNLFMQNLTAWVGC